MAKKVKKIELNDISKTKESYVETKIVESPMISESIKEQSNQESGVEIERLSTPSENKEAVLIEPTASLFSTYDTTEYTENVQPEPVAPVYETHKPKDSFIYSGKLGKITVSSEFLFENSNFFSWLSRDKYVIINSEELNGNVTFFLRGGDLQEFSGDEFPEYDIRISRGQLFLTRK